MAPLKSDKLSFRTKPACYKEFVIHSVMKRIIVIFILLLTLAGGGDVLCAAEQAQWQELKHAVSSDADIDIFGRDGVIVIRTGRRIQVRVFTILGQLVSQATLNPGESQLKVNSRGIYIVKVENRTQKVAL